MALTPGEKMRRRRQKLKNDGKYEEYKAVQRKRERRSYHLRKEKLNKLPIRRKEAIMKANREKIRQRVAKHRQLQKEKQLRLHDSPAYKTACTLGKATARARAALPKSPRKKKIVVRKLFDTYCDTPTKSNSTYREHIHENALSGETISKVKAFYERDDVSRQAPGIKDVVTVRTADGSKKKMQIRHLSSSILETHQLFCSELGKLIGKSKFAELRPHHVLLSNKLPYNICLCKYHENYISAVNSLHKVLPNFPKYTKGFIESNVICKEATEDCWLRKCNSCQNALHRHLDVALENNDAPAVVKWNIWKDQDKTIMKVIEEGTAFDLAKYIISITPQFLEHSYVKRNQADSYQKQREAIGCSSFNPKDALIQVDFSENFTCIAQDEVQSFHWVQPQVSLFTVSLWHSGTHHPIIIASDNLDHSKHTIVAYIDKLLEEVPSEVENVSLWSDGPRSQFKNRFIAASLGILQRRHKTNITWNYFATSHGKGPVDGIGGATKRQVRCSVLQRKNVVFNANQFVNVAKEVSSVNVFEMTCEDIERRNADIDLARLVENATPVPGISRAHCIRFKESVLETYVLTLNSTPVLQEKCYNFRDKNKCSFYNQVYGSSDSDNEDEDHLPEMSSDQQQPPKLEEIKHGTYVLVQFKGPRKTNYRYVAVCQSDVEDDGDVKIMCLKLSGESGNRFRVDEKDVSYVNFDQILYILPTPSLVMQGNRVTYNFNIKVDIYEKV